MSQASTTTNPSSIACVALTQLKRGQTAVIASASLHRDDEAMLAAMGLRTEARVQVCRSGQPCIVRVMGDCGLGCRIGLARPIASKIRVWPEGAGPNTTTTSPERI